MYANGTWWCKIRRGCNVLQVHIQIIPMVGTKAGEPSPPVQIKIVMACLRTSNSPLRSSSPTLSPNYLPLSFTSGWGQNWVNIFTNTLIYDFSYSRFMTIWRFICTVENFLRQSLLYVEEQFFTSTNFKFNKLLCVQQVGLLYFCSRRFSLLSIVNNVLLHSGMIKYPCILRFFFSFSDRAFWSSF